MTTAARRLTLRFVLYLALAGVGSVFLLPLAWMLVTSLKPIEQTMSLPPTWLPRAYYATLDGRRLEVTRDYRLAAPEVVAKTADGRQLLLSPAAYAARPAGLHLLHRAEAGWWHVTERLGSAGGDRVPAWDVLPPGRIETKIKFRWDNYPKALAAFGGRSSWEIGGRVTAIGGGRDANISFWTFLDNTLIVCVLGVAGTVFSNSIVAYGFARLRWRGRDAFFAITLATMMVPFPVLMVPLYGIFRHLGWIGTLLPLWAPTWFGSAFNIFLMRQFFRGLPEELSEAARIDGCSEWRIFWRIILPLSKPVLTAAALFHFLFAWNDFLGPLIYLTRKHTFTLALALQDFQSQHGGVQWHYLMAASAVTIAPIIVLFFFAQKTFIQGIATTGTKG